MIADQALASLPVNIVQDELADRRSVLINVGLTQLRACGRIRRAESREGRRSGRKETVGRQDE